MVENINQLFGKQPRVEEDDYRWITEEVRGLADDSAGGKLVSILEGGYDLKSLAKSSRAHVEALMV